MDTSANEVGDACNWSGLSSVSLFICQQDYWISNRSISLKLGIMISDPLAKNSIVNYRKNTIVLSLKYTIVKLL